jgi:hypothetical protein
MSATPQQDKLSNAITLTLAAVWFVSFFVARLFLDKDYQQRHDFATWIRVCVALLPTLPTALVLWRIVHHIRDGDELDRRVHLEALAFAFPMSILLLWTLGLLQLAIKLPEEDWSYRHVWIYLPLFYFGGLAMAWRRYR